MVHDRNFAEAFNDPTFGLFCRGPHPARPEHRRTRPNLIDPMTAFGKFLSGFLDFQRARLEADPGVFARLALRQTPKCMVIACCDSRVDPAILANAEPGELFIVRNVANLVPPYEPDSRYHATSAALEFAVNALHVEYIIVMGHAGCGGIQAMLANDPELTPEHPFIHRWMSLAEPARQRTLELLADQPLEKQAAFCEREVIKVSLRNLVSFPCIAERVAAGTLHLRGLYFDIAGATLFQYREDSGSFEPVR
jgi:carbonic anhydrase